MIENGVGSQNTAYSAFAKILAQYIVLSAGIFL
jgi:hypothetical protein